MMGVALDDIQGTIEGVYLCQVPHNACTLGLVEVGPPSKGFL